MINRKLIKIARFHLKKYPILFINGPRQSGKTTICKQIAPGYKYVNLELPDIRMYAQSDPRSFLEEYKGGVIIDEAQYVPELFSYIQHFTDERKKNGEYILSGSQNFLMFQKISQSLAGRVKIFNLLPFSIQEIPNAFNYWQDYVFTGFYPRLYHQKIKPADFYPEYIQTYLERDIRQITNVHDLKMFQKFLITCASRIGQLINLSQVGNDLGVDYKTVQRWISILETSYIVYQLPPYFKNIGKRLVKSSKLYFYDTGLLCNLLNIKNAEDIDRNFLKGQLFENFIINELIKIKTNAGERPNYFFLRDKTGNEIDLIEEVEGLKLNAFEIKAGQTIGSDFFKGLIYYKSIMKNDLNKMRVIYGGNENQKRSEADIVCWKSLTNL